MKTEPLVIVGLGNPGKEYAETRHNLGWRVVEALADKLGLVFKEEKKFKALVAKGSVDGRQLYLILPTTYMNVSGQAVGSFLNFYKLSADTIVVAVDDIALPFGQMRVRTGGGAGGHNGLKSIAAHLGTQNYLRLRLGIDRKDHGRDLSDYVLERFNSEERDQLGDFEKRAIGALEMLLTKPPEEVMNQINPKIGEKK